MRYMDSGARDPSQALGTWIREVLSPEVVEIRWQSGFFSSDALGILQPTLERFTNETRPICALIGSNDQCTLRRDVDELVSVLGMPREQVLLGVVSYGSGYYHPKTFHVRRDDGTQAAYVGSANLTGSGVSSLHVEAGITLDSRDGDTHDLLESVASAVDSWFTRSPPGLYRVSSPDDVQQLVSDGILAEQLPPRVSVQRAGADTTPALRMARLVPLVGLPGLQVPLRDVIGAAGEQAALRRLILPASPSPSFPEYLLFAPGQATPTQGITALPGSSLPGGVSGLIIRINRDSARHFEGRQGTANISIPVSTVFSFRFGLYVSRYTRPRAEFSIRLRYISVDAIIDGGRADTNIMAYGFIPGETGHGDVRMLVPAEVKRLAERIRAANKPVPMAGDFALLEWPNSESNYEFRLSFVERGSGLHEQIEGLFSQARDSNSALGDGASWLPESLSLPWATLTQ